MRIPICVLCDQPIDDDECYGTSDGPVHTYCAGECRTCDETLTAADDIVVNVDASLEDGVYRGSARADHRACLRKEMR